MNRTYITALGLLGISALISTALWLNGFPPEWDTEKGEVTSAIRRFLTAPYAIVATGSFMTLITIPAKRAKLRSSGKSRQIAVMSVLLIPILTLFLQIVMPLMLYDVVGEWGAEFLFLLVAAVFFLTIGNYIVTAEYGSRIGLRNKWTLADPLVWTKTHRFFGRSLVLGTLIILPIGLLVKPEYATYTLVGIAVSLKLIALLYARSLSHRLALRST